MRSYSFLTCSCRLLDPNYLFHCICTINKVSFASFLSIFNSYTNFSLFFAADFQANPINLAAKSNEKLVIQKLCNTAQRCVWQFSFLWIYNYGSNEPTEKEIGKTHICALFLSWMQFSDSQKSLLILGIQPQICKVFFLDFAALKNNFRNKIPFICPEFWWHQQLDSLL